MKNKIGLIICLFVTLISNRVEAQLYIGDVLITNQSEVDAFNYTSIFGSLEVRESTPGSITNLNGLNKLARVYKSFKIIGNSALEDLVGLEKLLEIKQDFEISNNSQFISFTGLEALEKIGGNFYITDNELLTNLNALEQLATVTVDVQIVNNSNLVSFCGIKELVLTNGITGELLISENSSNPTEGIIENDPCNTYYGNLSFRSQAEIDAFKYVHIVGDLEVKETQENAIVNLDSLSVLQSVSGNLSIKDNKKLDNFCGIKTLLADENVLGAISIEGNNYNPTVEELFINCANPIYNGNLIITEQKDIDTFSYTRINGNLHIGTGLTGDRIFNLSGLSSLTFVEGNLLIGQYANFNSMQTLAGLHNLTEVGGDLNIAVNDELLNLDELSSLVSIGGNLLISGNPKLISVEGLSKLKAVGNSIMIGYASAGGNPELTSLKGLENITSLKGNLVLTECDKISSLEGLNSLERIEGSFSIGNFSVDKVTNLTSLDGLENLNSIGGNISIKNNNLLSSIVGLTSLTEVGGNINFENNPALESFEGLEKLASVNGFLSIKNNSSLTSIAQLNKLSTIPGDLTITENPKLTSLNGLENVTNISGYLTVLKNESLSNLDGLNNVLTIGDYVLIAENEQLNDLCGIKNSIQNKEVEKNEYTVISNGFNPEFEDLRDDLTCSIVPGANADVFNGSLLLSTQNQVDAFPYKKVTGNLSISEAVENEIVNLDGLSSLTEIGGALLLKNNKSLNSITGLRNLTTIISNLTIENNSSLTSLNGLEQVTKVKGVSVINNSILVGFSGFLNISSLDHLSIQGNASLKSFEGLERLTEIGLLQIMDNLNLISFSGLSNLKTITKGMLVSGNSNLINFDGLEKVSSIYSLTISKNEKLISLDGLENLVIIHAYLNIGNYLNGNPVLASLKGLQNLKTIGKDCYIWNNNSLKTLDGLNKLTSVGGLLRISNNKGLTSLSGLGSLTKVDRLEISSNSVLENFCSLTKLANYNSTSDIYYSVKFNGINPTFENLKYNNICGAIIHEGDLVLTTQDEIDNFEYSQINGNLIIEEELTNSIIDLEGLASLNTVNGSVLIKNNASLENYCGLSYLILYEAISGTFTTTNNKYNPQINNFLSNQCNPNNYIGSITLTTQSAVDAFAYSEISGDLFIKNNSEDPIVNLAALNKLTTIGGSLYVDKTKSLASLEGLNNLNFIGENIFIFGNKLSSLKGFDKLTFIPGVLLITNNQELLTLEGLDCLTKVAGNVTLIENGLQSLAGFGAIEYLEGSLSIIGNNNLTSFCEIGSLLRENRISKSEFELYSNGYNPTYEEIQQNDLCSISSGNQGNGQFNGTMILTNQAEIENFDFSKITGNLIIREEEAGAIVNLEKLQSLSSIEGKLVIENTSNLDALTGLEGVSSVSQLFIITNEALTTLKGLDNLETISYGLDVGGLYKGNNSLISLDGLENLKEIGNYYRIASNIKLENFCGIKPVTVLQGLPGAREVWGNAVNPSFYDLWNLDCPNLAVDTFNTMGLHIYPNPIKDAVFVDVESFKQAKIYNLAGNEIGVYNTQTIHFENCTPGIYLLEVTTHNHQVFRKKIIKE
ncbi:T9SS type A sorting domain-containing protein [Flavicella sediminum]|uniref:T9SS type A sorting domain-containing protein n=1 Tax=Flavicella sediminum TaxID=2585141 RepID=UPI00111EC75D|nr:T9SS type A sorting domain-containing protein [Flavicella sediminum]